MKRSEAVKNWRNIIRYFAPYYITLFLLISGGLTARSQDSFVIFNLDNLIANVSEQVDHQVYAIYNGRSIYTDFYYEREPGLEHWMLNPDEWSVSSSYAIEVIEEEELEIEEWMTKPFLPETENKVNEVELDLECWMIECDW